MSTISGIEGWILQQVRPAPPKRSFLRLRPQASEAYKQFVLHYNRFLKQQVTSDTASKISRAVIRAETAKDLIHQLSEKILKEQGIQDILSSLQLSIFGAANWMRRFVDDRDKDSQYNFIQERKDGRGIADSIDGLVKSIFDKISSNAESRTIRVAFEAYEQKWKEQDDQAMKVALTEAKNLLLRIEKAWEKVRDEDVEKLDKKKRFTFELAVAQLEDTQTHFDKEQETVITSIKVWLKVDQAVVPPWRKDGIDNLGPFGIYADIPSLKIGVKFEEDGLSESEKKTLVGTFNVTEPKETIDMYGPHLDGKVIGALSPRFKVTIKQNDPSAALIRIPPGAEYFCFAYPVITGNMEVKLEKYTPIDAFLLYGGFVYFDGKLNVIQINALWVGWNLQLSAPRQLPKSVRDQLLAENRFKDITLPQLAAKGAKRFAWLLPGEFSNEIQVPDGGWCYIYENEDINNYFAIASASSVTGVTANTFTLSL